MSKSDTIAIIFVLAILVLGGLAVYFAGGKTPASSSVADTTVAAPVARDIWARGNASSTVTLTEYGDMECPACGAYALVVEKMVEKYGDRVHFEFRHFPLPMHKYARISAAAVEAAGRQGHFWDMLATVYAKQSEWVNQTDPMVAFAGYAETLGLDVARWKKDVASPDVRGAVEWDRQAGEKVPVTYTPFFLVNGKPVENPRTEAAFSAMLDDALAGKTLPAPAK